MEHRWNIRENAQLTVTLQHPDHGRMPVTVRNVSRSGLYITLGKRQLPRNTLVRLHVQSDTVSGGHARDCCDLVIPAIVAWSREGKAGLLFRALDTDSWHALRLCLPGARGAPLADHPVPCTPASAQA